MTFMSLFKFILDLIVRSKYFRTPRIIIERHLKIFRFTTGIFIGIELFFCRRYSSPRDSRIVNGLAPNGRIYRLGTFCLIAIKVTVIRINSKPFWPDQPLLRFKLAVSLFFRLSHAIVSMSNTSAKLFANEITAQNVIVTMMLRKVKIVTPKKPQLNYIFSNNSRLLAFYNSFLDFFPSLPRHNKNPIFQ